MQSRIKKKQEASQPSIENQFPDIVVKIEIIINQS